MIPMLDANGGDFPSDLEARPGDRLGAAGQAYMDRLCKAGSKARMLILPDIGHGRAAQASTIAAVDWMADRFAGKAPPDDRVR